MVVCHLIVCMRGVKNALCIWCYCECEEDTQMTLISLSLHVIVGISDHDGGCCSPTQ